MTGSGEFTTTTAGTMQLLLHGCTTVVFGFTVSCTTSGQPAGTVATATLDISLVEPDAGGSGILIKPAAPSTVLIHKECAGVQFTEEGAVIGTLTAPTCAAVSKTGTIDFNLLNNEHGKQEHRLWTGTSYDLTNGAETRAWVAHATISFPEARELICT